MSGKDLAPSPNESDIKNVESDVASDSNRLPTAPNTGEDVSPNSSCKTKEMGLPVARRKSRSIKPPDRYEWD